MILENWRILYDSFHLASENLALEEALLTCCELNNFTPTCRIWVNTRAVVIGRFQNASLEIDSQFCSANDVPIVRRFTGGGTVYHDEGNLNFTLVCEREHADLETVQLKNMTAVKLTLAKLGISSQVDPPNNLMVDGKKISGSAASLNRDFILWHASLLVSTNLGNLQQILSPSRNTNFSTNFVRSRWKPTTSIQEQGKSISLREVSQKFIDTLQELFHAQPNSGTISLREEKMRRRLHEFKYSKDSWNIYGQNNSQSLIQTTIAV